MTLKRRHHFALAVILTFWTAGVYLWTTGHGRVEPLGYWCQAASFLFMLIAWQVALVPSPTPPDLTLYKAIKKARR